MLICGVAGSGKTSYAQRLEATGYVRLSIDEEVWTRFGRYGIDYEASLYEQHSEQAEADLRARLLTLVRAGQDVVVDFSFWQRSKRDLYRRLVADAGGHARIVYLRADPELLRTRLAQRAARFDANAAFPIDDVTLERFLSGFEPPEDEDEQIIDAADSATN